MNQTKKKVTAVYMWIRLINVGIKNCLFREVLVLIPPMPVDLMLISIS